MKVYGYGLVSLVMAACTSMPLWAQQQQPKKVDVYSGFVTDSVKIGERTAFYLSTHYPSELTVLLPDSAFSFAPFEYEERKYFPTQSTGGQSVDSVVYYLSTFEVDALQTLSLPAFVVNERDCTEVLSNTDTIRLVQLVKQMPDSVTAEKLPLKENTAFADVPRAFNYPVFLIVLGVVLLVLVVLALVFGKRLRRHFKIRRLLRHHEAFQKSYIRALEPLRSALSVPGTESALVLWKQYMEQLEARPYTKLTTREMLVMEKDETLGRHLKAIDGVVYGHGTAVMDSLENLKSFADRRFQQKLEEAKHAR
jgi:hypothetical protein